MIGTDEANSKNYEVVKSISKEKLLESSLNHIEDVRIGMNFITNLIKISGNYHDLSKIEFFDEYFEALKSNNFKNSKWYEKHLLKERHHLRDNSPEDVTFIDIIEHMVNMCTSSNQEFDWKRASIDPRILIDAYYNTLELIVDYMELKK